MRVRCADHKKHHKSCFNCDFESRVAERIKDIKQSTLEEAVRKLSALGGKVADPKNRKPLGLSISSAYINALADACGELRTMMERK